MAAAVGTTIFLFAMWACTQTCQPFASGYAYVHQLCPFLTTCSVLSSYVACVASVQSGCALTESNNTLICARLTMQWPVPVGWRV